MKFYNPFKWHIVEFADGMFGIRKFDIFELQWGYQASQGIDYVWYESKFVHRWCMFDSIEHATKTLLDMRKRDNKICVVRVVL